MLNLAARALCLTGVLLGLTGADALAAAPANDHFADAAFLSSPIGAPAFANGTNVDATLETGEPTKEWESGKSVWYKWQADTSETVAIDTCGSDFNTNVAVYTGTTVDALTLKGSSDDTDTCGGGASEVVLGVKSGQHYRIKVDGTGGATGSIDLNITDHAPIVSLQEEVTVTEKHSGTSMATFTVTLSEPLVNTVITNVVTYDESAESPEDYKGINQSVTFPFLETSKTFSVPIVGDPDRELDETFFAYLGVVSGPAEVGQPFGRATIVNDDGPPPALSIADLEVTEGDAGTTNVDFTVSLADPAPGKSASVYYGTYNESAHYDSGDYVWKEGQLNFAPGESEEHVSIAVKGDETFEPTETFNVEIGGAKGATIAKAVGHATILNDDPQPEPEPTATPVNPDPGPGTPPVQPVEPTPPVAHCVVPKLKGKRLRAAKAALRKAGCALGRVRQRKSSGKRFFVVRQSRVAGRELPSATKVNLVLRLR